MFAVPEQLSVATKANFESQLATVTELTNKAFEGIEKFIDLNLSVAKASLEESHTIARQLLSAKDPQEFFSVAASQSQPNAEKTLEYGRHLATIVSSAQAEITKAVEAQFAETNRKILELVEEVTKNAPPGSESAVTLFKTAIGNANAGYEQFAKSTKQAVETIESNLSGAVNQFSQATEKVSAAAKK